VSRWLSRTLLAIPFAIASVLQILVLIARPLGWKSQHIAGYALLFGTPWAWLLDRGWFDVHNRLAEEVLAYTLVLWVPALLYSLCLWMLLRAFSPRR